MSSSEATSSNEEEKKLKKSLLSDRWSILILLFLYTLQGKIKYIYIYINKSIYHYILLILITSTFTSYITLGIPMGLAGSIPMLLQSKKIGYRQQAIFSFVSWPFSIKLLWAPIVDAIYSKSFGRRKSW